MIWRDGECRISDDMTVQVWGHRRGWTAAIYAGVSDDPVWQSVVVPNEDEAKAAVCHWIGKTMAQLSNALAEGYPEPPDDGA